LYQGNGDIGEDDDNGSGIGKNNIYKDNKKVLVLALLSDSYSELEIIFVSVSELSSCPTLHFLLTISTTDYYLEKSK